MLQKYAALYGDFFKAHRNLEMMIRAMDPDTSRQKMFLDTAWEASRAANYLFHKLEDDIAALENPVAAAPMSEPNEVTDGQ